jgi:hypothetical protein
LYLRSKRWRENIISYRDHRVLKIVGLIEILIEYNVDLKIKSENFIQGMLEQWKYGIMGY